MRFCFTNMRPFKILCSFSRLKGVDGRDCNKDLHTCEDAVNAVKEKCCTTAGSFARQCPAENGAFREFSAAACQAIDWYDLNA